VPHRRSSSGLWPTMKPDEVGVQKAPAAPNSSGSPTFGPIAIVIVERPRRN
jgi:hypothetical protein